MDKLLEECCKPNEISPLNLAFVGDGVYDLMVREFLVTQANRPVGELNNIKISLVCCKSQAKTVQLLSQYFSDKENSIYKRGRNAKTGSIPKNSTSADYHSATGLEALFGYLYLSGESQRLKQLFNIIITEMI